MLIKLFLSIGGIAMVTKLFLRIGGIAILTSCIGGIAMVTKLFLRIGGIAILTSCIGGIAMSTKFIHIYRTHTALQCSNQFHFKYFGIFSRERLFEVIY